MSAILASMLIDVAAKVGAPIVKSLLEKHVGGPIGDIGGMVIDAIAGRAGVPPDDLRSVPIKDLEAAVASTEMDAPQLGDAEGVAAASYVHVQSIFCRDGSPYSSASIHLASDIFELGRDRFQNMATVVAIDDMREVRVRTARQTLTVGCADPGLALALEVPVGSPTLVSRRVIVDERGVAISVGDITYRSDVIQLEIDLMIDHPNATWRSLQRD